MAGVLSMPLLIAGLACAAGAGRGRVEATAFSFLLAASKGDWIDGWDPRGLFEPLVIGPGEDCPRGRRGMGSEWGNAQGHRDEEYPGVMAFDH